MDYRKLFSLRANPQSEPIQDMVANSAGGHAFAVDDWTRLDRFLILGSEGGSYYAGERALTRENATATISCIEADGMAAVARIVEISHSGRAPKNDPAIFALALASALGNDAAKRAAMTAIPQVCRTGTHLFQFAEAVEGFRGWGRGLRRGIAGWYTSREVDQLALQLVKYRQRGGWSHRDLLRLAHPLTDELARRDLFDWACRGTMTDRLPPLVAAYEAAAKAASAAEIVAAIEAFDLPREAIGTEWLNDAAVWRALLQRMPMTALVRNLGKLSAVGVLKPLADDLPLVMSAFQDADRIAKARLHPLALLLALKTYAAGKGDKGSLEWEAVPQIVDALNAAFYTAFKAVEPTGKRLLLALDVSGSMGAGRIAGTSLIPREGSAAMALMTAATEQNWHHCRLLRRDGQAADHAGHAAGCGGAGDLGPALRPDRLRAADAIRAAGGPEGGCVRDLYRQRDLGG